MVSKNKYGLLGRSLKHSFSPALHQKIFEAISLDGQYVLIEKEPHGLDDFFKTEIFDYDGINVTIPYKKVIMPFLTEVDEMANLIGAVNTIDISKGRLIGYNTDYQGFSLVLDEFLEQLSSEQLLMETTPVILGTGGASKSVIASLIEKGYGSILWVTRNKDHWQEGEEFLKWQSFCLQKQITLEVKSYGELETWSGHTSKAFFLINTTPVGMYPDVNDLITSEACIKASLGVIDLIYNPKETRLIKCAKVHQKPYMGGLGMLIEQGIKAEEIWQKRDLNNIIESVREAFK